MSEFDKLRALLDLPKDTGPTPLTPCRPESQSTPKAVPQEAAALQSSAARRRRLLWPFAILLVITAGDALYLFAKALIAVPR
jgi:hypothetical protein